MTQNPAIPERYRCDHLFLLVGTNPLPNYVAGKLLLNSGGRLYLVHSDATRPTAERLSKYWIDQENGQRPQFVPVDEADSVSIRSQINRQLTALTSGRIGLNYTGGTKIMSVHACRTLLDFQEKERRPVALSYLDARSNRMHIEYDRDALFTSEVILYELKPKLQDLVSLHGAELASEIATTPQLPDLARALYEAHSDAATAKAWRAWCECVLKKSIQRDDGRSHNPTYLRSLQIAFPTASGLSRLVDNMKEAFQSEQDTFSLQEASQRGSFKKASHLCKWFDGLWLEHYVLYLLNGVKNDKEAKCQLNDLGMGIEPKTEDDRLKYEVDIGVMQGYRLYAISCTTDDDKGMCKLKLFEAYTRARNMGGDEARVGLICLNDNPSALENQVGRSWDAAGMVRVFGRPDIGTLAEKLTNWFRTASV